MSQEQTYTALDGLHATYGRVADDLDEWGPACRRVAAACVAQLEDDIDDALLKLEPEVLQAVLVLTSDETDPQFQESLTRIIRARAQDMLEPDAPKTTIWDHLYEPNPTPTN